MASHPTVSPSACPADAGLDRPGRPLLRALPRAATTLVAGTAAGALSAYIAIAGDGDGRTVDAASRLASGYLPYAVIVFVLGVTAPSAVHAVARATLSQVIMVLAYYTWKPMISFSRTPTMATHYAQQWLLVAVTAVPLAALVSYALRRALKASLRPSRPRQPERVRTGRA
ncbi:hypothetical protein [Streptomyces monomycini]|uniref:hypothetical protein n=1 Tax=Streptomyces monomycini TaxID=371720 RepID=UPI0004AB4AA9|nr:hypothetical protein [Streptomyces monomycini]